jgi:hypothetical protein
VGLLIEIGPVVAAGGINLFYGENFAQVSLWTFTRQRVAAHDRRSLSFGYLKRNLNTYHSAFSPSFQWIFLPSA